MKKEKSYPGLGARINQRLLEMKKNQTWLAGEIGVGQSAASQIISREATKHLLEISEALNVNVGWLKNGKDPMYNKSQKSEQDHRSQLSGSGIPLINQERIPVYAPIPGEPENVIRFSKEYIVGYEPRPGRMQVIRDDFYVSAYDDSMAPRHYNGEDVYVHPTKPPSIGKDCVYVEEATGKVFIRVFWGETATEWKFSQLNPVKEFSIDKSEVRKIFAVLR